MQFDNTHQRSFKPLNWYDPTTWFGQPSVPPPKFEGTSQDEKSAGIQGWKQSNANGIDLAVKNEFVAPFKKVEQAVVSDVDKVTNELTTIKDGIVTGFRDIKDEFSYVGSEVKIGFGKTEQGIEWGYTNIVKPLAIDTITLLESTVSTINWLVANRTLVLVAVGSYGAFRFMNEAKMALVLKPF